MGSSNRPDMLVTGVGVTASIGQGKKEYWSALLSGRSAFHFMQRPGRQQESRFIGAEISAMSAPAAISSKLFRKASFSGQVSLVTLYEAWVDAKLDLADPSRIGLIIGGSNVQQREMVQIFETYRERTEFVPPSYGLSFMDSDLCGLCTEQFGIQGMAYTVGGASASGQLAVIQAIQEVRSGQVDICIALGAMMDLSYLECQALRALGAMGTDRYADHPELACRPFDQNRDGFIYGESCGALVIERAATANSRQVKPYAAVTGSAVKMDANRNPNPSLTGEVQVIQSVLQQAGLSAREIDYLNPHGSGSPVGDETELRAIHDCGLSHVKLNTTKSITGHGLTAAGAVEIVTTLLQMRESRLHPSKNLENPLDPGLNWVGDQSIPFGITNALSLSFGFGGINTAICLQNI
ncbi:Polyketide biosynthesis malonyl-ACP decarboxylase PksF [compost metagenome]